MKLLSTLFCIAAVAGTGFVARADVYQEETPGVLPSKLTDSELQAPVTFELLLSINSYDVLKRHAIEISASALDVGESYTGIVGWLRSRGFTVLKTDPSCSSVIISGTRKQMSNALNTHFVRVAESGVIKITTVPGGLPYRPSASILTIQNMIVISVGRDQMDDVSEAEYSAPLRFELPSDSDSARGQ